MAVVDPNQESPNVAQPVGQPVAAGGAGVAGPAKASSVPGVNVPAQPSAQLSAYLNTNQPQTNQFAGQIANTLGQNISNTQAQINPAVNTYTGQLYTVPTDASTNQQVATSPSALTPTQTQSFENELGAAGNAPNSAATFETTSPYSNLTSEIQNNVEQANLWNQGNSIPSLTTAIAPFETSGANSGDTALDALLLSQTPSAYSQIQQATAPAAQLPGQLATGTAQADQALQAAIAADQAATPAAQGAAQQYVSGLNQTLAQYLANAQTNANEYNASLNSLSGAEANTQPDFVNLQSAAQAWNDMINGSQWPGLYQPGVNNGTAASAFGLSPINIASPSALPAVAGAPPIGSLASPQNYSDIQALQNLLGQSEFSSLNPSITPDTAAQAGTYSEPGTLPTLSELYNPVTESEQLQSGANVEALDSLPFTQSLVANPISAQYNAVQNAYNTLAQYLGLAQQTVAPVPTVTPTPGNPTGQPAPSTPAPNPGKIGLL